MVGVEHWFAEVYSDFVRNISSAMDRLEQNINAGSLLFASKNSKLLIAFLTKKRIWRLNRLGNKKEIRKSENSVWRFKVRTGPHVKLVHEHNTQQSQCHAPGVFRRKYSIIDLAPITTGSSDRVSSKSTKKRTYSLSDQRHQLLYKESYEKKYIKIITQGKISYTCFTNLISSSSHRI